MLPSSLGFSKKGSFRNENSRHSRTPTDSGTVEEMKTRIAVRYFVKKSKRFDLLNYQLQRRQEAVAQNALKPETPECLLYLGLSQNNGNHGRSNDRNRETRKDFQFPKPRVYECNYCPKIFFHKLPYRRHMIKHIKRVLRCSHCNRGFSTKISQRRHQLTCRR